MTVLRADHLYGRLTIDVDNVFKLGFQELVTLIETEADELVFDMCSALPEWVARVRAERRGSA